MNKDNLYYHVLDIIRGTTVDGPGFRTAIYLSGCGHKCRGCHNPQSWDSKAGSRVSLEQILETVEEEDFDVTLTGGDPLYNPLTTMILAKHIKEMGYKIWLYTGYVYEEIKKLKIFYRNLHMEFNLFCIMIYKHYKLCGK